MKSCVYCDDGSYANGENWVKCDHCKGTGECTWPKCKNCLEVTA